MRPILIRSIVATLCVFGPFPMTQPSSADVAVGVSVAIAPPDLPVYDQPICPGEGYIWTPGYWAWDPDLADYYWVPGTWVEAPRPGLFWTPGYWAWGGSGFVFTAGYWGPVVGFYGGIHYGFGYLGEGYVGGRWDHGHFFYNTAVNNINVAVIHNTYRTTVVRNDEMRVSYNGGRGGINAHATPEQEAAARERHVAAVAAQTQQANDARNNPELRASVNHGRPAVAATPRAGDFSAHDVVAAREAGTVHTNSAAADRPAGIANERRPVVHPNDIPRGEKPTVPNTGNAKLDQKYEQQQEKLAEKQTKENHKLQRKQDQEHQRANQQQVNEARQQQMEQRHQQQTEQLMQRHQQETQRLQQRQPPARAAAPSAHDSGAEKK
jgi:Skp family chaperone for outer membrane proteins